MNATTALGPLPTLYNDTILDDDYPGDNDTSPIWELPGDEATKSTYYNLILWLPFILIPSCIILSRIIHYAFKNFQAKANGQDTDLATGIDPFLEFSLALTNNQAKLAQIKKIKKEQVLIKKWKDRHLLQQEQCGDSQHNCTHQ